MTSRSEIFFEEATNVDTAELLDQLTDPEAYRRKAIPLPCAHVLKRQQIDKLQANIQVLRRKQEEFTRRMDDYIQNIHGLIRALEGSMREEANSAAFRESVTGGTQVRCVGCGSEKKFDSVLILSARDSADAIHHPTEVVVDDNGTLRKGTFRCPSCGNQQLLIRDLSAKL